VRARDTDGLTGALRAVGIEFRLDPSGALLVDRAPPERVGEVANDARVALSELTTVSRSLEDVFLELTGEREGPVEGDDA
jgi:hypothetical protein